MEVIAATAPDAGRAESREPVRSGPPSNRAARVHELGIEGSLDNVAELIAALADPNGNVRRLAASALGKLRARAAVESLVGLVEREPGPQVRQYAINALGRIGDERARAALEGISTDPGEMHYNRLAAAIALGKLRLRPRPGADLDFLVEGN